MSKKGRSHQCEMTTRTMPIFPPHVKAMGHYVSKYINPGDLIVDGCCGDHSIGIEGAKGKDGCSVVLVDRRNTAATGMRNGVKSLFINYDLNNSPPPLTAEAAKFRNCDGKQLQALTQFLSCDPNEAEIDVLILSGAIAYLKENAVQALIDKVRRKGKIIFGGAFWQNKGITLESQTGVRAILGELPQERGLKELAHEFCGLQVTSEIMEAMLRSDSAFMLAIQKIMAQSGNGNRGKISAILEHINGYPVGTLPIAGSDRRFITCKSNDRSESSFVELPYVVNTRGNAALIGSHEVIVYEKPSRDPRYAHLEGYEGDEDEEGDEIDSIDGDKDKNDDKKGKKPWWAFWKK